MTVYARGLADPETPVFLPDGSLLVAETAAPDGAVALVGPGGRPVRRIWSGGRPNGVALALDGIWMARTMPPSLVHLDAEGAPDAVVTEALGKPFRLPNDLCHGPDGLLYVTDSGIDRKTLDSCVASRADWRQWPIDGRVVCLDARTLAFRLLGEHRGFVNGLAFAPSGELAVCETATGDVWLYERPTAGRERRLLATIRGRGQQCPLWGPDGMAYALDGRLFVALYGHGEIAVLDAGGRVVDRIATGGAHPTNVAFGPAGEQAIYVTEEEHDVVERYEVAAHGAPVFTGAG